MRICDLRCCIGNVDHIARLEEKRNEQIYAAREFTREMAQMGGR